MASVIVDVSSDAKNFKIDAPTSPQMTGTFNINGKVIPLDNSGNVVTNGNWTTRPSCRAYTSTLRAVGTTFYGAVQSDNTALWNSANNNQIDLSSSAIRYLVFEGVFVPSVTPTPSTIEVATTGLQGASVKPTSVQSDDTNIVFTITHDVISNGKWTQTPKIECLDNTASVLETVTLTDDGNGNYSGTLANVPADTANIYVSGTYEEVVSDDIEIRNNIGANVNITPTSYVRGTVEQEVTIAPTNNRGQWTEIPSGYAYNSNNIIVGTLTLVPSSDGTNNYMTILNGSPFGANDGEWAYIVISGAYEINTLADNYGLIGLYEISDTQIPSGIINSRYPQVSGTYDDTGKYILGYYRYPFEVEVAENGTIQFGWNNTGVSAPKIAKTIYEFTLFDVVINGLYKDNRDIGKAEITMYLPFLQAITIDSIYINTKIRVTYKIDIVSNKGNVYLFSNEIMIGLFDVVVGFSVPYITGENLGYGNLNGNYLINITPTIKVVQSAFIDNSISSVGGRKVLGNLKGYIRAERLEFKTNIPIDAIANIEKLLNAGIINNYTPTTN